MMPRPPVRALAVAALLTIAGAAITVTRGAGAWGTVLLVVGIVLILGGVALALLAFAAPRGQRVVVLLDEEGYRVDGPAGVRIGKWATITRVTATPGRLTLYQGDRERLHLVSAAGPTTQLDALGEAISRRLDAHRGYKTFEG